MKNSNGVQQSVFHSTLRACWLEYVRNTETPNVKPFKGDFALSGSSIVASWRAILCSTTSSTQKM